jgi:hypothetical protein
MSKSNTYEQTLNPDYPSGDTEAQYIDDIFRAIKQAQKDRLDQEHYWRSPDDAGYDVAAEGGHRPQSARVYSSNTSLPENGATISIPLPGDFPATNPPKQYDGLLISADGDGELRGSLLKVAGTRLKHVLKRVRGIFTINGRLLMMAGKRIINSATVSGLSIDESDYATTPDRVRDNITVVPFLKFVDERQVGQESSDPRRYTRLVYPVLVGSYRSDGTYDASSPDQDVLGVEFVIGNPASSPTRVVISKYGIEVFGGSGQPIYFNGVNVREHDHSGREGMGKKLDLMDLLPEDGSRRLSAYTSAESPVSSGSFTIPEGSSTNFNGLSLSFKDICPPDEDLSGANRTKDSSGNVTDWSNYFLYVVKLYFTFGVNTTSDRQVAYKFTLDGSTVATGARILKGAAGYSTFSDRFEAIAFIPSRYVTDIRSAKFGISAMAMGNEDVQVSGLKLKAEAVVLKL